MFMMYVYPLVFIVLCGFNVVISRDTHSRMVHYKHTHHIHHRAMSHENYTVVQDGGELSQKGDRCWSVAFRCYEPILSYIDGDGQFCGWKNMNTFRTLPAVCTNIGLLSSMKWVEVVKYTFKYIKTCDKIKTFQQCVQNNEVCREDKVISFTMSQQNTFCNNIQAWLSVNTCANAWDSSVNWNKLVYTDWRIVQACPAKHYKKLSVNTIKLVLFNYISSSSSWTDKVIESVNAEAAGRYVCQHTQQDLCLYSKGDAVCNGFLPLQASECYTDRDLVLLCQELAFNFGKCIAFLKMNCIVNLTTGQMITKIDFQDILNVYNFTYWHTVSNIEVDILLHTDNKGIGHCDVGNLILKQIGCFHQYITQINLNYANHSDYLSEYMCSNIKIYTSCFEAYINSSCPDEAQQFQGIGSFVQMQCSILTVANKNVTCPLHGAMFMSGSFDNWFHSIMKLMQQYITVIRFRQINPEPSGWRDAMTYNADLYITIYKSLLIKGEKRTIYVTYGNDIISAVCDQETAAVYNDFVTLSTGEQFYQFVNHAIKGFEYIKYLAKGNT